MLDFERIENPKKKIFHINIELFVKVYVGFLSGLKIHRKNFSYQH